MAARTRASTDESTELSEKEGDFVLKRTQGKSNCHKRHIRADDAIS